MFSYLKKNSYHLFISLISVLIVVTVISSDQEVKTMAIVKNISNETNVIEKCSSLIFPWNQQNCLQRVIWKKEKICYLEKCKKELFELKKEVQDITLIKVLSFFAILLSILGLTEFFKKMSKRATGTSFSGRLFDLIDRALHKLKFNKDD